MTYHIGFPTDNGCKYDGCVYRVYSKKCQILGSNKFYVDTGLENVRKFLEHRGHEVNLEVEIFSSKGFEPIPLQGVIPDIIGTSNSAAYILSAFQEKPKEDVPLVLISMDLDYPEGNSNILLKELGSSPESLLNKLKASLEAQAIALVLHEKDAEKLKELNDGHKKLNDENKELLKKIRFTSLSRDAFKKIKENAEGKKISVIGCKTDQLFLLADTLGIKLDLNECINRRTFFTRAKDTVVGAIATAGIYYINKFRDVSATQDLESVHEIWKKHPEYAPPNNDGKELILSIKDFVNIERSEYVLGSIQLSIDLVDDFPGGRAYETVKGNLSRGNFQKQTYIIPEWCEGEGILDKFRDTDLFDEGKNNNKIELIVIPDDEYKSILDGKHEGTLLKTSIDIDLLWVDASKSDRDKARKINNKNQWDTFRMRLQNIQKNRKYRRI